MLTITVGQACSTPAGLSYTYASPSYCNGTTITTNSATLTTTGSPTPTFSVSPTLPTGLSLNTNTGAITGTPTVNVSAANYTVTASNSCGTATKVLTITVGKAPAGLSYTYASPSYCNGTAITTNSATLTTTGSPAPTFSVSPALPTGLSLNTSTGAITGTPTVNSSAANYTVTASNSCGTATKVLAITVGQAPAGLNYTSTSPTYINGTAITTNSATLTTTGSPTPTFSVSPALPTGLSLNTSTGAITGTPTVNSSTTNYTVTASNSCGTATKVLTITVGKAPAGLNYTSTSPTYINGTTITTNSATLTTTGSPAPTFSVSPALPTGLSLNTSTGAITGTPTVNVSAANYTVTASNSCGTATKVLAITVGQAPAGLNYTSTSPTYINGTAITTNSATLTTTGSPTPTFSVSPALPTGLSLNTSTGAITGTPTVNSSTTNYTVTASNSCGTASKVLAITVGQAPAGLNYTNASPSYINGAAITTNSATLTTTGSPAPTFSVSPTLPTGLSLNTSTGAITGTPTANVSAANYTVTATNIFGNTTKVLTITVSSPVIAPPSNLSANGTTLTVQNGSYGSNGNWVWYKDFNGLSPVSTTVSTFTMSDSRSQRVRVRGEYTVNSIPGKTYFISQKVQHNETLVPSSTQNYIVSYSPVKPRTTMDSIIALPLEEQGAVVQYFDGLGRPTQTVAANQSYFFNDVVTGVGYDSFGRQDKTYLPLTKHGIGAFVDNQASLISSFYNNAAHNEVDGLPSLVKDLQNADIVASQTVYEPSPLNRVTSTIDPAGGTTSYTYGTNNATDVTLWTVNDAGTLSTTKTYDANELYMTQTTDPDEKITKEYKDKQGQMVLKRSFSGTDIYSTYYVYDDFGLLRYVLSPEATAKMTSINYNYTPTDAVVKGLCYYYQYDARKRMVKKQLPGADEVLMVYDTRDRLVLVQDGKTRAASQYQWLFTKYDDLNRPIQSGLLTINDKDWGALKTAFAETIAFPTYTGEIALTKTHYDNYTGCPLSCAVTGNNTAIKGMVTWSWSTLLDDTQTGGIVKADYYDNKYRVIDSEVAKVNSSNTVVSDLINVSTTNTYDFVGKLMTSIEKCTGLVNPEITINKYFYYDHAGRLEKVEQEIANDSHNGRVVLAQNDYNDLGQLMLKKLHMDNDTSYVQDINYLYDVRGWLKSINNFTDATFRKLYAQDLAYNANGNVNTMNWKNTLLDVDNNPVNSNKQTYGFTYDGLNRMLTAGYSDTDQTTQADFSSSYSYYPNGNFHTLSRYGNKNDAQSAPSYGPIDNLTYNYIASSNQLSSVGDAITSGVSNPDQYAYNTGSFDYDKNGNATKVPHKQITNINYNYLNLPSQITIGGQNISYLYDAAGNKLRKTFGANNTYYQGSVLKINDNQLIVLTGEGRAIKYGTDNWTYEYDLKDHLGNTRVSFMADNATVQPLQYKDYYPFGMEMGNWYSTVGNPTKYLYNGKELQDEGGLDWYDYGARFYDPAIGRTSTLDPHAENHYSESPYSFLGNNPINSIDPDGMDWYTNRFSGDQKWYDDNKWKLMYSHNEGGSYTAPETTITGTSKETRIAAAESYEYEQNLNQQGIETYRTDSRLEAFANMVSLGALTEFKGLGNLFKSSKTATAADDLVKVATKSGWEVGEPVTNLTAKGNVPAWSTVRQRFWKNESFLGGSAYSESNLLRMKKGLAPQRLNPNTGLMESMELHHHVVPQRNGGLFDFMKVWPDEHRALDPFRK